MDPKTISIAPIGIIEAPIGIFGKSYRNNSNSKTTKILILFYLLWGKLKYSF